MKWIIRIGVIMFAVFCGIKAVPEEKVAVVCRIDSQKSGDKV